VEEISRISVDTSKHFFQLHGVNVAEKAVLRKKLRRKEMVAFFEKLAPTVIGIEACGASHHWARLFVSFGHEVKLIAVIAQKYVWPGIGLQMVAAEFMGRCVLRRHLRPVQSELKLLAPLRASTAVGKCRDLHAETGTSVRRALRSSGATFVAMMQTAHLRQGDNLARRGRLDWARLRTILIK
jgi:transposase